MKGSIGFLGPFGTFGHEVAKLCSNGSRLVSLSSHLEILDAVEKGEVDYGIVAVENSIDGAVNEVLDHFIWSAEKLTVCGEVVLPVNQCVFVKPGIGFEDVRIVISHPKGLGQCAKNIHQKFPNAQQIAVNSTAAAVPEMLKSEVPAAAIAGKLAAREGSVVLTENFQDVLENSTRFWIAGREKIGPTGNDKTSFVFETKRNKSGSLLPTLSLLASFEINMSSFNSRPAKKAMGQYVFLVDVDGHMEDEDLSEALRSIKECTARCKIFGSYPKWKDRENS